MKKHFAEFVASGKSAKKFLEEVQTSDSLSGAFGNGGVILNKDGNGVAVVDDADNGGIPMSGSLVEDADPLGSGPAPSPTSPEAGKDQSLTEEADPLGNGPAPSPTSVEPGKDQPL